MAGKWLGKSAQKISEAVNKSTEKTEYEPEFMELIQKSDATKNVIEKLIKNVPLFLHPNPAARAKLSMNAGMAKLQKKAAAESRYPHVIGELAEICTKSGQELTDESSFGLALMDCGEVFTQITELTHGFDNEVQHNFIDPLKGVMEKDLKEIAKHRKKLESRRLDFDYKRRKAQSGSKIPQAEVEVAEKKMEDSKSLAENAMNNLLAGDIEQVSQLQAFVSNYLAYSKQVAASLEDLVQRLEDRASQAHSRPKRVVKERPKTTYEDDDDDHIPAPSVNYPCCRAVFDFEAEVEDELSFKDGDLIKLTRRVDENWLEGEVHGRSGRFPSNYVEIIKDI